MKPQGKSKTDNRTVPDNKKLNNEKRSCYRCLGFHHPKDCPFIKAECHACGMIGHIKKACRKKNFTVNQNKWKKNNIKTVEEGNEKHYLNCMTDSESKDMNWSKTVKINNKVETFEIDTGACQSIVSIATAKKLFSGKPPLTSSNVKLYTYSKSKLNVLGELIVDVNVDNMLIPKLKLLVIKENGPSLIGKTWLKASKLFWPTVNMVQNFSMDKLMEKYPDVFTEGIGKIKGPPVSVKLQNDAKPVFLKARPVPFAFRKATDIELDRLINENILKPVDYSDWASPIVIVNKPNGSVRICGDYRATVNKYSNDDQYPLPRTEELFSKLSGSKYFTVFDLKDAYFQQPVDEETSKILTINTHRGLFNVKRLAFGIKCAPGLFQRKIENILKKFDYVGVFLDDVIISGATEKQHIERVECILKCFLEHGIKLNKDKCKFMVPEVSYLGHRISKEGIRPMQEKVDAIVNAPSPENVSQLRSFLGLISYYRSFLPNISDILEPLYRLLDKNVKWVWSENHEKAFQKIKILLSKAPVLEIYDVNKDIVVNCDASDYGVGCVLSHVVDGFEKPVAYASRTMNKTERNYAQIDKEALAIIFALKKFHQYIAGNKFLITTDHKPLLRLFDPVKRIPETCSPRILRWSLLLSGYNYKLDYRKGKNNSNADALSRLPLPETVEEKSNPPEIMFVSNTDDWPVTSKEIAKWTLENPILKKVLDWVKYGWPEKKVSQEFDPYFRKRDAISCLENCLLWGHRVIIPDEGRDYMLKLLHSVHQGMSSMKAKARSIIWWPNMDREIEQMVNSCERCQMFARDNPKSKPLEWQSGLPWERIHVDHAGPFQDKHLLIVVDAFTKWVEVEIVPNLESTTSVKVLRKIFATFGLPLEVVSDNGPSFRGFEFEKFLKRNGITHTLTPPYSPSSNGQAERYVQTVKSSLKKIGKETNMTLALSRFLLENHTTPHSKTGKSPAELMFGRPLRTALHLVLPVETRKTQPVHTYKLNEDVFVKNFGRGEKWMAGKISKLLGSKWVLVDRNDGIMCKRHIDQLRRNREISFEMTEREQENVCRNESKQTANYEIPIVVPNESNFSRNDEIPNSENADEPDLDLSQSSRENVPEINRENLSNGNVVVKESNNDKTQNKTIELTSKSDGPERRSKRKRKPVVRLNYGERGVVTSQ